MSNQLVPVKIDIDQNSEVIDTKLAEIVIKTHHDMMLDGDGYKTSNIASYISYAPYKDNLLKITFSKQWRLNVGNGSIDVIKISLENSDHIYAFYKICNAQLGSIPVIGTINTNQYWLEQIKLQDAEYETHAHDTEIDQEQEDKIAQTSTKSMKLIGVVEEYDHAQYMTF